MLEYRNQQMMTWQIRKLYVLCWLHFGYTYICSPYLTHPPTTSAQKLPLNLGDLQFEQIVSQLADQNLLQRVQGMETRNKQLEDELQRKSKEQKLGFASGDLLFVCAKVEPFTASKLSPVSRQEWM